MITGKYLENPALYSPDELERLDNHIEKYFGKATTVVHEFFSEDIHVDVTDRLKAHFEKSSPLSVFDAELFSKTVTAVLLTKNGAVSLFLKNGNIIGKEKNKDVNASSDNA